MKNILRIIGKISLNTLSVLAIICIIIAITYVFQILVLKSTYANIFGYSIFTIETGSMQPTLEIGDTVIVKLDDDYKENDIVVYQDENMLVAHRVIKIDDNLVTTKGDYNNTADKPFSKDNVIGKVVKIIPKMGLIQNILKNPFVLIAVLDIIVISNILSIYFRKKGKTNLS